MVYNCQDVFFIPTLTEICDQSISVTMRINQKNGKMGEQLISYLLFQHNLSKKIALPWCFFQFLLYLREVGRRNTFHWWNSGWTATWYIQSIIIKNNTRDMDFYWPKYVFVGISFLFHFMKSHRPHSKKLNSLYNGNLIRRFYISFTKMLIIYVLKSKHWTTNKSDLNKSIVREGS